MNAGKSKDLAINQAKANAAFSCQPWRMFMYNGVYWIEKMEDGSSDSFRDLLFVDTVIMPDGSLVQNASDARIIVEKFFKAKRDIASKTIEGEFGWMHFDCRWRWTVHLKKTSVFEIRHTPAPRDESNSDHVKVFVHADFDGNIHLPELGRVSIALDIAVKEFKARVASAGLVVEETGPLDVLPMLEDPKNPDPERMKIRLQQVVYIEYFPLIWKALEDLNLETA